MPHFYFDTHDGVSLIQDTEGVQLPNKETAQLEAQIVLGYMAKDRMADSDRRNLYVDVLDEARAPIYTICMAVAGRWLG